MDGGEHRDSADARYALLTLGGVVALLGAIAAFIAFVDPYRLLGSRLIEGVNADKTTIFFYLPTVKAYQFQQRPARGLVLGTSRAGRAIDPGHESLRWPDYYNFATPGSPPAMDRMKLEAAIRRGDVEDVIFFVDFFPFNSLARMPPGYMDDMEDRLGGNGALRAWLQRVEDYSNYLFSWNSIRDSVQTIRDQAETRAGTKNYTELHDDGRWDLVFSPDRKPLNAFRLVERSYLSGSWFPADDPRFSLNETTGDPNRAFADFHATMALAQAHDIRITLVLMPVHARLLELMDNAGLWPLFEHWKRQLVAINESVAAGAARPPFDLWDFNGYYPPFVETVTKSTSNDELHWVYDSAHINLRAGDRLLSIVAGDVPPDFGGKLTGANIESWLQQQRALRQAFREDNPALVTEIRRMVNRFHKNRPWQVVPIAD